MHTKNKKVYNNIYRIGIAILRYPFCYHVKYENIGLNINIYANVQYWKVLKI